MFSESLTIRILGDSAPLQRELDGVGQRIADLESRLSGLGGSGRSFGLMASGASALLGPLESVSRLLGRITGQVQALNGTPILLNVAPALSALSTLSQFIDLVSVKLRMLSAGPFGFGIPGAFPMPIRMFASGGLVTGPGGADRVPALLTAGEFVLRRPAVRQLGAEFLNALNQSGRSAAPMSRPGHPAPQAGAGPVTHFGGITINVAQAADVNGLVRDLRLHGARLRNRRG